MTATQTSTGAGSGELSAPVEYTDTDDPTGRVDYDGPRCGDCGSLVDEDGRCDDCGDGAA